MINKKRVVERVNKKGQVAVFIVIALVIVVVLVLFFVGRDRFGVVVGGEEGVDNLKDCIGEGVDGGIEILSLQGGSIAPENYYLYDDEKVDYLCYTEEDYSNCIMQKPLLKQAIEKELEDYIKPKVQGCLNSFRISMEKKGYDVSLQGPEIRVELFPNNIQVTLKDVDLNIVKDEKEIYSSVKVDVNSKLYELVMVASSIANWEARYGDAEIMNYMINYPSLEILKKPQDDGTKIYILTNKKFSDKFMFASRSMVIPVGFTGE